jgi:MYXO-CTERM domain-containing protein
VTAATVAFQTRFEGCGTCVQTQRITYANQALAAYGSDAASAWGATFVSQSFPYAAAGAVTIVAGRTASVSLTLRNSGTRAWDARTCLGTTQVRDRTSPFAGAEWPGRNRPACVPAGTTVASGASHTFTWTMHAPATAGRYDEHWGVLEEGVAWFSDPGQGGPADNDLEGVFTVTPAPPPPDAGVPDAGVRDAGGRDVGAADDAVPPPDGSLDDAAAPDDAGTPNDAGAVDDRGSAGDAPAADDVPTANDVGDDTSDAEAPTAAAPLSGGCGCRTTHAGAPSGVGALLAFALVGVRRRRRSGG